LVRSIGAGQVIDYTMEDFTRTERRYDVMPDLVGAVHCRTADGR